MDNKEWVKQFEEINGRKPTILELAEAQSTQGVKAKSKNIKNYMVICLALVVIIGIAGFSLNSIVGKSNSQVTTSSTTDEEKKEQLEKLKKEKQEEIQKIKDQLTDLDNKIIESEKLVEKLKEETFVPKLDIESIRKNDLSSLQGEWRSPSGNQWLINDSGEIQATWLVNNKKTEAIIELDNSHSHLKNRSSDSKFEYVESVSARIKNELVGGFIVVAVPGGTVMKPSDDGKLTDKTNHDEDRLFTGQQYEAMLLKPENVYYRVKPDTSQLEAEQTKLTQLSSDRDAKKLELESKEK